jgi:superoxide dismutase, Fe-Mn family
MSITLKHLDYELNALEPVISARTMAAHYGKHYAGYVSTLASLIKGTEFEHMALDEIVQHSSGKPDLPRQTIFNNAAQIVNHEIFWDSLAPNGGGAPPEPVRKPS